MIYIWYFLCHLSELASSFVAESSSRYTSLSSRYNSFFNSVSVSQIFHFTQPTTQMVLKEYQFYSYFWYQYPMIPFPCYHTKTKLSLNFVIALVHLWYFTKFLDIIYFLQIKNLLTEYLFNFSWYANWRNIIK